MLNSRWIFILEGILTVVVAVAAFWWLYDYPKTAKFLTPAERIVVSERLSLDTQHLSTEFKKKCKVHHVARCFRLILSCIRRFPRLEGVVTLIHVHWIPHARLCLLLVFPYFDRQLGIHSRHCPTSQCPPIRPCCTYHRRRVSTLLHTACHGSSRSQIVDGCRIVLDNVEFSSADSRLSDWLASSCVSPLPTPE